VIIRRGGTARVGINGFMAGANTTCFHHHVVVEAVAIDHDGAKTRIGNIHARTIRPTE